MTRALHSVSESLARATVWALATARWEAADLASRRPSAIVPDLLDGRAAELAFSPIADDQLLSLALEVAARDLRAGGVALAGGVHSFFPGLSCGAPEIARSAPLPHDEDLLRVFDIVVDLEARRRSLGLVGAELSGRLAQDAQLQEILAEDPRIPAVGEVRRRIRASVGPTMERSRALDPNVLRDTARRVRRAGPTVRPGDAELDALRRPPIVLGEADRERLTALAVDTLLSDPRAAAPLLQEIGRASVMPDDQVPADVVRIGSSVEYAELFGGALDRVVLVGGRPEQEPGRLSVLTSTGSALIGLSVGQSILWKDHIGLERLVTVTDVGFAAPGA